MDAPRLYQLELLEVAMETNVIVCLEPGTGKTLIAVMLVKAKARELGGASQHRFTAFLVPTVALVSQQAASVRRNADLQVKELFGAKGVDRWSSQQWASVLSDAEVLVMTPQVLLDALRHGFIKMEDINLLVMDECHHTRRGHPYQCIMQEFYFPGLQNRRAVPQVFGMTASPAYMRESNKKGASIVKVKEAIASLEKNLHCIVVTASNQEEVERCNQTPNDSVLKYAPLDLCQLLQDVLDTCLERLSNCIQTCTDAHNHEVQQAGRNRTVPAVYWDDESTDAGEDSDWMDDPFTTPFRSMSRALQGVVACAESLGIWCASVHMIDILEKLGGKVLTTADTILDAAVIASHAVIAVLAAATGQESGLPEGWDSPTRRDRGISECLKAIQRLQTIGLGLYPKQQQGTGVTGKEQLLFTPKVLQLVSLLAVQSPRVTATDDLSPSLWSCFIFVQQRVYAFSLLKLIKSLPQLGFLSLDAFIGGGFKMNPRSQRHYDQVLGLFRRGDLNCLIATSVAEEGLDIKQCQLVIRFDLPNQLHSFVQSRGRARMAGASVVLMVEHNNRRHFKLIQDLLEYQKNHKKAIVSKPKQVPSVGGANSAGEKCWDIIGDSDDEQTEATAPDSDPHPIIYTVASTGARITSSAAVTLLYRYCVCLPKEAYTAKRPRYRLTVAETPGAPPSYRAKVHLPMVCPVKTVIGEYQATKKGARQSCAIKACKELHRCGELNDNLIPTAYKQTASEKKPKPKPGRFLAEFKGPRQLRLSVSTGDDMQDSEGPEAGRAVAVSTAGACRTLHLHAFVATQGGTIGSDGASLDDKPGQSFGMLALNALDPPGNDSIEFPIRQSSSGIHPANGQWGRVKVVHLGSTQVTQEQLQLSQRFHQRVFELLFMSVDGVLDGGDVPDRTHVEARAQAMEQNRARLGQLASSGLPGVTDALSDEEWAGTCGGSWYVLVPLRGQHDAEMNLTGLRASAVDAVDWDSLSALDRSYVSAHHESLRSIPSEWSQPETEDHARQCAELAAEVVGQFVITDYNGRCHQVLGVRPDLTPLTDFHTGCTATSQGQPAGNVEKDIVVASDAADVSAKEKGSAKRRKQNTQYRDFAEYYSKKWSVTGLAPEQPLLEAKIVTHRLCHATWRALDSPSAGLQNQIGQLSLEGESSTGAGSKMPSQHNVLLVPELCSFSFLSPLVCRACQLLPQLLWRLEGMLKAAELRSCLVEAISNLQTSPAQGSKADGRVCPNVWEVYTSITSTAACEEVSYERLEMLGDAFLKFAAALFFFRCHPAAHEGRLSALKDSVVGNMALKEVADKWNLKDFIRFKPHSPLSWRPPGVSHFARSPAQADMECRGKVLADVVEALLGAFFVDGGVSAGFNLLFALGVLDASNADQYNAPIDFPVPAEPTSRQVEALQNILGYEFRHPGLLQQAMVHSSWIDSSVGSYERLEFLGDAVLDLLFTSYIHKTHPDVQPGRMTDLRQAALNNERLSRICIARGLHRHLMHCSATLFREIEHFVADFERVVEEAFARDHVDQGGGERLAPGGSGPQVVKVADVWSSPASNVWAELLKHEAVYQWCLQGTFGDTEYEAPKVLGDILEAVVGAVFLDSDQDLERTWAVVKPLLEPIATPGNTPIQPLRQLMELCDKADVNMELVERPAAPGSSAGSGKCCTAVFIDEVQVAVGAAAASKRHARKLAAQAALEEITAKPHLLQR